MFQKEQEEIQRKLFEANRGLTWDDTRRMPLTGRVCYVIDKFNKYSRYIPFFFKWMCGLKGLEKIRNNNHYLFLLISYTPVIWAKYTYHLNIRLSSNSSL